MIGVLVRRENRDMDRHREGGHMRREAGMPRLVGNYQKLGEAWKGPPWNLGGSMTLLTRGLQTSGPRTLEQSGFLLS